MTLYVRKAETPVNIYDMMKEEEEKELLLQTGQDLFFLVITDMFCQKDLAYVLFENVRAFCDQRD